MRAVFFSDVHLVKNDAARMDLFYRFAGDVLDKADQVFILGDLFDFYHGYDNYVYPWYQGVAEVIRDLTARGRKVFFVEGNHEFGMGAFFGRHTGATCMPRELSALLDGKRLYLSHGDSSDRLCLGRFLKSSFVYAVMDALGPRITWTLAKAASFFLSRRTKPYSPKIKDIFRSFGRDKLDTGYDTVILAHSHIADKVDFNTQAGRKTYINTGDFGVNFSFVSYETATGFELKTYNG